MEDNVVELEPVNEEIAPIKTNSVLLSAATIVGKVALVSALLCGMAYAAVKIWQRKRNKKALIDAEEVEDKD